VAKPKKGSDKPLYYYKGENGKLIPIKGSIKWTDLSAKDKKKVAKTVVKGTTGAATRGALMAIPSPKKIKAGVKAIDEARKLRNAKVFLNDLKKNGVAVSKPSSPFIGMTNSASARSARLRAEKSGKVTDLNKFKKRRGK
jgi:hypothetical protein